MKSSNQALRKQSLFSLTLHIPFFFLILCALTLNSCSSPTPRLPTELDDAVAPSNEKKSKDLQTIVLMETNDQHGALAPLNVKTKEAPGIPSTAYEIGGASILASHIKLHREAFGPNFVWLDAGDAFQGTLEANETQGEAMIHFFNALGMNAATIGNHEFDYGAITTSDTSATAPNALPIAPNDTVGALKKRISEAHFPYVISNVTEKSTGKTPFQRNAYSRTIIKVGPAQRQLNLGVIGVTTPETPSVTRGEYITHLQFNDIKETVLKEAQYLRNEGAQIIVLLAHVNAKCENRVSNATLYRRQTDPQGACDENSELGKLLLTIPQGTVDTVFVGHSHVILRHWLNGTPIIESGASNHYYTLAYLTYDWKQGKLVNERTRIEGPIPICAKVFENQKDCNGDRPAPKNGRGPLITPVIHGKPIFADSETEKLLAPYFLRTEAVKKKVIGQIARPVGMSREKESEMGNLITDALRAYTHADVALINPGGLRAPFEAGPLNYDSLFHTLPFSNSITTLELTGKELKTILRVAENGSKGWFPVSNVQLKLLDLSIDAPSDDLDLDGTISPWEARRLLDAQFLDGTPIEDKKRYTLATLDFLVKGGDSMGWAFSQISADRIHDNGTLMRDGVAEMIKTMGIINSIEKPLVDLNKPRYLFIKSIAKGKAHKKSKVRKKPSKGRKK